MHQGLKYGCCLSHTVLAAVKTEWILHPTLSLNWINKFVSCSNRFFFCFFVLANVVSLISVLTQITWRDSVFPPMCRIFHSATQPKCHFLMYFPVFIPTVVLHSPRSNRGRYKSLHGPLFNTLLNLLQEQSSQREHLHCSPRPLLPRRHSNTSAAQRGISGPSPSTSISSGSVSSPGDTSTASRGRQEAEEAACRHFKGLACFHSWRQRQEMSWLRVESRLQMVEETIQVG